MSIFTDSLITVSVSIIKLFLLSLVGFIMFRKKIISSDGINSISSIIIYFTLPALIFSNFSGDFSSSSLPYWYLYPVGGILLNIIGISMGYGISGNMKPDERSQFAALLGLHNSGYLPLAISAAILSGLQKELAFNYIFLVIMGTGLMMWTFGVKLLSAEKIEGWRSIRNVINPPFVTIIISLIFAFSGIYRFIPELVLDTASIAGDITIPLVMIVLGGILAKVDFGSNFNLRSFLTMNVTKLIIFPAIALVLIYYFRPPLIIGFVILLQAACPPATNLIVIGNYYGKRMNFLNRCIFYSYMISIITLPVMISIFYCFYKC